MSEAPNNLGSKSPKELLEILVTLQAAANARAGRIEKLMTEVGVLVGAATVQLAKLVEVTDTNTFLRNWSTLKKLGDKPRAELIEDFTEDARRIVRVVNAKRTAYGQESPFIVDKGRRDGDA